jgi:hypothetical protein
MTDNVVRVVIGQTLVGGSSVWGGITGDLEDQTDLQQALDGKATTAQGALADSAVQPGDLAAVATTGAYADLSGKPTLGTAAAEDVGYFATAAQGAKADTSVQSLIAGITGADAITNCVSLTAAEYAALGSKSATTLYIIAG